MYTSYDDVAAVCPYYKGGSTTEVRCKGCAAGQVLILRFVSNKARRLWRSRTCDRLPGYDQCPFYDAHEDG